MEKMLKNNNKMTGAILFLLCVGVWLGYSNGQAIARADGGHHLCGAGGRHLRQRPDYTGQSVLRVPL